MTHLQNHDLLCYIEDPFWYVTFLSSSQNLVWQLLLQRLLEDKFDCFQFPDVLHCQIFIIFFSLSLRPWCCVSIEQLYQWAWPISLSCEWWQYQTCYRLLFCPCKRDSPSRYIIWLGVSNTWGGLYLQYGRVSYSLICINH